MLVLDVGMQVGMQVVHVMALAAGVLRQAVPEVAGEMWCLRCSLGSPQLPVVLLTLLALTASMCECSDRFRHQVR